MTNPAASFDEGRGRSHAESYYHYNKPGPAQVGAISKAQNSKRTSKSQFTVLGNRKKWTLTRAPGALKGGHFRNCQHFCRS